MTYNELVKNINSRLRSGEGYHEDFGEKPGVELMEVNAWTYWQGMNVREPRILVLGQDWGSLREADSYFKAIEDIINAPDKDGRVQYFKYESKLKTGRNNFDTDANLTKNFELIGYSDILHQRYDDLFFTNLISGYRKNNRSTGGFKAAWITEQVKEDLKNLILILHPQVILCLGKDTYVRTAMIYGYKKVLEGKNWNDYLDGKPEPKVINEETGYPSYLFALPHPGYWGMRNRGRDKNEEDWKRLKRWLDNHKLK